MMTTVLGLILAIGLFLYICQEDLEPEDHEAEDL